jgi:hypothetical protein
VQSEPVEGGGIDVAGGIVVKGLDECTAVVIAAVE